MKTPKILYDACKDGKEYFSTQNTLKNAWFNCKRPDWMLWALTEIGYKDDKNLRLFSCKCACDTPLSDGRHTYELLTDQRSIDAIEVSIRYAYVKATREELESASAAARDAARDEASAAARAARDAAGAAGRDAAGAAGRDAACAAARDEASYAARAAASAAARDAARDEASAAARAARDAAGAAGRDAAGAAGRDAASAAARDAARDEASAAAGAAAGAAQAEYLRQFIAWEDVDKYIKSKL